MKFSPQRRRVIDFGGDHVADLLPPGSSRFAKILTGVTASKIFQLVEDSGGQSQRRKTITVRLNASRS